MTGCFRPGRKAVLVAIPKAAISDHGQIRKSTRPGRASMLPDSTSQPVAMTETQNFQPFNRRAARAAYFRVIPKVPTGP
jgi:hypothetical protein